MASFYLEPEDKYYLASLSSNPIAASLEIAEIGVDPERREWTFRIKGGPQGDEALWEELGQAVRNLVPEVSSVRFEWTLQQDSDEYYLQQAVKQVRRVKQTSVVAESGTSNNRNGSGRQNSRRKRSLLQGSIGGQAIPITDLQEEERGVVIEGEVVSFDSRLTRTGKTLIMFDLCDGTDSLSCKAFLDEPEDLGIKKGKWFKIRGNLQFQSFDNQLALMVQGLTPAQAPPGLKDDAPEKRVELHLHTKMSGLDGTINVAEVVELAASLGHEAIAITDHGVVQAFPDAHSAGRKHGVKILYGVEGYLVDEAGSKGRSYHIIILAKNQVGLQNLYRLVSSAHLEHFYRTPRIPRALLEEHREGLILGSACEAGEVYQAILTVNPDVSKIASFYDYLEIQPLENNGFLIGSTHVQSKDDLMRINKQIVKLGDSLKLPVVATGDVHYLRPEDSLIRTILLAGRGFEDAERQTPVFYRTTNEMLEEFSYLGAEKAQEVVITNPRKIAAEIEPLRPVPEGLHPPHVENAEEDLEMMTYKAAKTLYGDPLPPIVAARLERELKAIIGNGYASLYLIAQKLVKKSLDNGYLVGSRGSVGSSLVATMCDITEVNPLVPHYVCPKCYWSEFFTDGEVGSGVDLAEKDCPVCGSPTGRLGFEIPFEVFMGFHGEKVPDIDLNFSGEYQAHIHEYTAELFGSDKVFRAGTIGTLADKTAFGFVMKYLEQSNQSKRNAEVNRLVGKLAGARRTTGQHPGGMVVVPPDKDIFDFTPIQYPANDSSSGTITTHFEYHALEDSLVKLDILGHDDPTMLRFLQDLTGVSVLDIPLDDPKTMSIFSSLESLGVQEEEVGTPVGTLGVPEFGTRFVRQMLIDTSPKSFSDLVRISGLSHGTNVWTNNAQNLIRSGVTDLSNVIATRDDIMSYLMLKGLEAGDAFRIMEQVRKGRGLSDDDTSLLQSFEIAEWYIDSCKKISYMFPKAHAVAYVMMAFRIAFFKVHYPLPYYSALFSLRAGDLDAQLLVGGEPVVRAEIEAINAKGFEATPKEKSTVTQLEIVLEALARGVVFLPVDLYKSTEQVFLIEDGGLRSPLASLQGMGVNAAAGVVESRKGGEFISIEDLRQRSRITKAVVETLRLHGCLADLPETNQLTLF
ncbi:MAG TPA: PolC-type DNA polymerase III [Limnochordia bacterium]|nr:PolC-type DNA polymerase III [Limnochordia bacterium]